MFFDWLSGYRRKTFEHDVKRMYYRVFHAQLPDEKEEMFTKRAEITEKVIATEHVDLEALTEEERGFVLEKRQKKIKRLLNQQLNHWKDIE